MYMIGLVWIFLILFARMSSTYDSRTDKGKYIVIKNDKLARVLIEKHTELGRGRLPLKKDRKKMSIYGLILYVGTLFIILLTLILLVVPDIPCEPFEFDSTRLYLFADTLNAKIPIVLSLLLLCISMFRFVVLCLPSIKCVEYRWLKIFIYVLLSIAFLVCGGGIVGMIIELFRW